MVAKVAALWVLGLLTIVPYGTYYLFFHAERDQYALLITLVLFWIFGFWGVAGPVLAAIQVRKVFRAIERAKSREELLATLHGEGARTVAIELIAGDFRVPRFIAARVYKRLLARLASEAARARIRR